MWRQGRIWHEGIRECGVRMWRRNVASASGAKVLHHVGGALAQVLSVCQDFDFAAADDLDSDRSEQ